MKKDSVINATFMARGDRGELRDKSDRAASWTSAHCEDRRGREDRTIPGDTTFTHQLRAFVKAVRSEAKFPTDGAEGIINMRVIDDVYRAAGLPPRATN